MKKVVAVIMFVCCVGIVAAQPVLAANAAPASSSEVANLLNVNDANPAALTTLPGIGKVTAERIVAYRTEHGPFKSVDELVQIKGIGQKVLAKIRPLVTI
jgi:competence protein ComEA